jgi:predicted enzyme related to lactoylglutathione lyase
MSATVSVSIDVPDLTDGVAFYCAAFGFTVKSRPMPGVAVLRGLNLERVEALGAKREQMFENPEHGSAAFCSDPFGHGFCLLERRGD